MIHVDLLNKILFTYEKAQSYGLDDVDEMQIIDKSTNKKVYYMIEGNTDSTFQEYINGE